MSYGQNYAVQSTVQLLQPYSVYLSDYATDGNQKLRVILQQGDLSRPVYQLRLVMSVELNGRVIMRTSRFFNPAPITLDPGVPTVIAGAELAPYVDSRNIDFIGYSKEQYEKTKALPEGSYQIIFTAYDYRRQDQQVSNAGSAFYYLAKNEPPLINYPACGSKLPIKTPQQIIFSWMPRNTSSPTSAQDTEYEFTLYETRPEGRNPNDVVLSSQPVFRLRTDFTQIIYGPAEPMLLDNMVYVWRVQAIDRSGKDAFRNNGYSEVCTFKYGGTDPNFDIGVVKGLNAIGETDQRAKVWWEPGNFDAYRVYYKKPGDQWQWFFNEVTKTEFKIFDLEPDNEYEVRVQGKKDGYYSPFTEIIKFRTREKIVAQCGDPSVTPEVIGPLQQAYIGMTINMSGSKVTLTKIENLGGGWYKGYGKAVLRYLGATYDVKFDRLYIDENLEAGDGDVDVITRGMAAMATEQLTAQKEKQQEENRKEWAGTDFYEKIVSFDYAIDNITVDASGNLLIDKKKGPDVVNTEVPAILAKNPDKAIIAQDANGDQFVIQRKDGQTKVTKVDGGGLSPGGTNVKLKEMIIVSLKKYQKAIDDYQASNKAVQPGKGGGPSLFAWELETFLADLPECLADSKDRLDEIESNIVSLLASKSTTFEDFVEVVKNWITEIDNTEQEDVDQIVCEILTEDVIENIDTGLSTVVNGDTLTTANQIFIVKEQSFKIHTKYNKDNSSDISFRLTIKPEGGGADILNPSSDWKKVQNNENWELDFKSVQEGMYILSYKIGTTSKNIEFYIRTAVHDYACSVCGRNLKITATELNNIFPKSKIIKGDVNTVDYFNQALQKGGFTTCHRQAHFFSQIFVESRGMNASIEGSNYSVSRILEVHDRKTSTKDVFFKQSFWNNKDYLTYASSNLYETSVDSTITKYEGGDYTTYKWKKTTKVDTVRIPTTFSKRKLGEYKKVQLTTKEIDANGIKLLNLVYSNLNGNGNVVSGDGYTFRGRGAIQLTGRETYREVAKKCNAVFGTSYVWETDFTSLESENKAIIYSVAGFFLWKLGDLKKLDTKDVTSITKKVNGGDEGLATRKDKFDLYLKGRLNNCKIRK
jgi:predicted chitinase